VPSAVHVPRTPSEGLGPAPRCRGVSCPSLSALSDATVKVLSPHHNAHLHCSYTTGSRRFGRAQAAVSSKAVLINDLATHRASPASARAPRGLGRSSARRGGQFERLLNGRNSHRRDLLKEKSTAIRPNWLQFSLGPHDRWYSRASTLGALWRTWHCVASTRQPQRHSILSDLSPDAHVGYLVRIVRPAVHIVRRTTTAASPPPPTPRLLDVSPGPIETTTGGRERWQTVASRL
jgi:hypothetical protein